MVDKELYTVAEFVERFGVSRTKVYHLIGSRALKAVHVGRRTFITRKDAEAWLESLRAEAA